MKNIKFLIAILGLSLGLVFGIFTAQAQTAPLCDFTRDLEVGDMGEDVRCLQKFLNNNGFQIAASGVGAPGSETDIFGELTKEALTRWQTAQSVSPASGYFGPKSRMTYSATVNIGSSATPVIGEVAAPTLGVAAAQEIANKINEYIETIKRLEAENATLKSGSKEDKEEAAVRKLLQEANDLIEKADDTIDDADDATAEDLSDADDDLSDAVEDLFDGLLAFVDKDFVKARSHAEDSIESAEDVVSNLGGDEDEAADAIDDAREAIRDAEDEINEADDDGDDVDEAEDRLNDAEDKLDEAEEAYDDEDFDEALELAEEAEDLAQDAVQAIGN